MRKVHRNHIIHFWSQLIVQEESTGSNQTRSVFHFLACTYTHYTFGRFFYGKAIRYLGQLFLVINNIHEIISRCYSWLRAEKGNLVHIWVFKNSVTIKAVLVLLLLALSNIKTTHILNTRERFCWWKNGKKNLRICCVSLNCARATDATLLY